ncbi:MFS transporter [Nonomuraea deserti]|uniref:MFS transporter n=1 Tax=Nonomuraea deserti TaxID=1848322 RepID=UPI001C70247A|nr:MFS transporter [Nonomuraea deserti]
MRVAVERSSRDFNVFWAGQTLSVLGSSVSTLAFPLLILAVTGSVAQMGLITAVATVVNIAAGLVAGPLVDRCDRRMVMLWCDWGRAALHLAVPLVWTFTQPLWLLYAVAAAVAALTMVFQVAYIAAIPGLVPESRLTDANGRLQTTYAIASVAGPVLAGALSGAVGPAWAVGLDGLSFALSAVSLLLIRLARPGTGGDEGAGDVRKMFTVGFRFLWRHPVLRSLTILLTVLTFVTLAATDLLIFRLRDELHHGDSTVGTVLGVAMAGSIAGAMLASPLRRRFGFGACWLGSAALLGAALAALAATGSAVATAIAAVTFMFGLTVGGVCSMSLRQELTPGPLLGRVTSAFWTVHNAAGPVGVVVLTAAADRYGVPPVALAASATCLATVLAGLFTPAALSRPELSDLGNRQSVSRGGDPDRPAT